MNIEITITNKDGDVLARSEALSFQEAEEELGKLERYIEKKQFESETQAERDLEMVDEAIQEEQERLSN